MSTIAIPKKGQEEVPLPDRMKDMRPVELPSGAVHHIHESEVESFNALRDRYVRDNSFTNQSDLADFDRVLIFEQLVLRWTNWLSTGVNFQGTKVDTKALQEQTKNLSAEVRALKASLNLDKASRDKQRANDDIAEYIEKLGFRAKHFGYKRNEEFHIIYNAFKELEARIGLYERCDERDRREQKANLEDIYEWLVGEIFPRLKAVDEKFRTQTPEGVTGVEAEALAGGQRVWAQEL